jgi:hypothetical protein
MAASKKGDAARQHRSPSSPCAPCVYLHPPFSVSSIPLVSLSLFRARARMAPCDDGTEGLVSAFAQDGGTSQVETTTTRPQTSTDDDIDCMEDCVKSTCRDGVSFLFARFTTLLRFILLFNSPTCTSFEPALPHCAPQL